MWDATSRSMHFRFEALRNGNTNINDSVLRLPTELELKSTVDFSSPLKKSKNV